MNSSHSQPHARWTPFSQPHSRWTKLTVNLTQDELYIQSTSLKMNPIHGEPHARWTPLTVNPTTSLKMDSHHSQPHSRCTPLTVNFTEDEPHSQWTSGKMNSTYSQSHNLTQDELPSQSTSCKMNSTGNQPHWRWSPLTVNLTHDELHLQSTRSSIYSYSHWRYSPAPWPKNKAMWEKESTLTRWGPWHPVCRGRWGGWTGSSWRGCTETAGCVSRQTRRCSTGLPASHSCLEQGCQHKFQSLECLHVASFVAGGWKLAILEERLKKNKERNDSGQLCQWWKGHCLCQEIHIKMSEIVTEFFIPVQTWSHDHDFHWTAQPFQTPLVVQNCLQI